MTAPSESGLSSDAAPAKPKRRLARRLVGVALGLFALGVALPPFYWPVRAQVTSGFLFRLAPDAFRLELHDGIDIGAARGTRVFPAATGRVAEAGPVDALGNRVVVEHLLGFRSVYAHLDRIDVGAGALVFPGLTVLGLSGSTGRSTGPHLHFALFLGSTPCPPGAMLAFHSLRTLILGW